MSVNPPIPWNEMFPDSDLKGVEPFEDKWLGDGQSVHVLPSHTPMSDELRLLIAAAVDAERERCASVVENLEWFVQLSPDHIRGRKPEEYAAAIRSKAQ